jgi:hypothetical protein
MATAWQTETVNHPISLSDGTIKIPPQSDELFSESLSLIQNTCSSSEAVIRAFLKDSSFDIGPNKGSTSLVRSNQAEKSSFYAGTTFMID